MTTQEAQAMLEVAARKVVGYVADQWPEAMTAKMDLYRALAALDEARKEETETCPTCKGSFYNPATNRPCRVCHGTGERGKEVTDAT